MVEAASSKQMVLLNTSVALLSNPAKKTKAINFIVEMICTRGILPVTHTFAQARDQTVLHLVAAHGNADNINKAIQAGAAVDALDQFGYTMLHAAARHGNLETFSVLSEQESLDVDEFTTAGLTPLMLAVQSRNEELIAFILEQSANPFFYDCLNKTALDYANFLNDDRKNEIVRQIAVA